MGFSRRRETDLEARLRAERPKPPAELMERLSDRVATGPRPSRRGALVLAGIAVAAMIAAFGAFGGIGYAASAAKTVVVAAKTAVVAPVQSNNKANSSPAQVNGNNSSSQPAGGTSQVAGTKPDDKQYGHKTTICHNPGPHQQTLEVSDSAVPAHLAHGDHPGPC